MPLVHATPTTATTTTPAAHLAAATTSTPTRMTTTQSVTETLNIASLAKYVPLRLTPIERSLLTVLEQTLHVSEYTDHVDVTATAAARRGGVKTRRILDGILEVCHIATGLAITSGQTKEFATLCQEGGGGMNGNGSSSGANPNDVAAGAGRRAAQKLKKALKTKSKKKKGRKIGTASSQANALDQNSWVSRSPADNEVFFQTMFEIGRRNKVLNPSSMRTTYGKLMYMLQDAQNPSVAKSLGFSLYKDMWTVERFLEEFNCLELLEDPRLECAVQFISDRDRTTGETLSRDIVQALVQGKQRKLNELVTHYQDRFALAPACGGSLEVAAETVRRVVESLADAVAYIESNVRPVELMLAYLEQHFDPSAAEKGFSLALRGTSSMSSSRTVLSSSSSLSSSYSRYGLSAYTSSNSNGPTLSHSHADQYTFVWQSLRLWSKVMKHMHRLWCCADQDLLSTVSTYHLYNTGQGLNRVQSCPKVRRVMSSLLQQTQQEAGQGWVGLSVIHLGDRDVPNALIFIDKYTQIPRFLHPIGVVLQQLQATAPGSVAADPRLAAYLKEQFGSIEALQKTILADYFKHGFDGSGDDGGSCIDGRLTSSWNWTSQLSKKSYYHVFMLTGFQGFDGEFR